MIELVQVKLKGTTPLSGTFTVRMRRFCYLFGVHISQKVSPEILTTA